MEFRKMIVYWQRGILNKTRNSELGLSILEENKLYKNDMLAECQRSARFSKDKRHWNRV